MGFIKDAMQPAGSLRARPLLTQIITLEEDPLNLTQGDILFLHMNEDPIRAGDIVVFNIKGKTIPVVHRVIQVHEQQNNKEIYVLTKGDINKKDDRLGGIYGSGQLWLQRQHIMGRAIGFLPYEGWVTIVLTENPIVKYVLIGALSLVLITSKDRGAKQNSRLV
ncbi:hypothetical protein CDL15_Pgr007870 [Punica granatum]|uniref:Signal peptidase complex catalytic subunit SEC11 n=1 Tax=Punica granatum TaxID=22663 RepID=A0A218XBU9_PUNGR|nr:hypothetical protein CDL15_Pgr007870 [Punica granatum]